MAQNNHAFPTSSDNGNDAAANMIRGKIQSLHNDKAPLEKPTSHHEHFLQAIKHLDPKASAQEKQAAWQQYYDQLSDAEKHEIWRAHAHQAEAPTHHPHSKPQKLDKHNKYGTFSLPGESTETQPKAETHHQPAHVETSSQAVADTTETDSPQPETVADLKSQIAKKVGTHAKKVKDSHHFKPLLTAFAVGAAFLLINYNQIVVAQVRQFISPGSTISTPIIVDPNEALAVGDESRIIIPKINVDVPVVYDVTTYDEQAIQNALERGVVHYGTTPVPGQPGNNVIVGHSSNNFFNSGKYKFAFVLLDRLEVGDTFILHYQGTRYVYRVSNKQIIEPNDFSVIQPTAVPTTTLITCTPPGTSWRRLVVQAEQISPEPTAQTPAERNPLPAEAQPDIVPGNAPSLWQRILNWF